MPVVTIYRCVQIPIGKTQILKKVHGEDAARAVGAPTSRFVAILWFSWDKHANKKFRRKGRVKVATLTLRHHPPRHDFCFTRSDATGRLRLGFGKDSGKGRELGRDAVDVYREGEGDQKRNLLSKPKISSKSRALL